MKTIDIHDLYQYIDRLKIVGEINEDDQLPFVIRITDLENLIKRLKNHPKG